MNGIRGIGDVMAFQRLLWLLVGTVIVPTIILALFGVMAIGNQRAAMIQQYETVQADRIAIAVRQLIEEVDQITSKLRAAERGCSSPCTILPPPGVRQVWVYDATASAPEAVKSAGLAKITHSTEPVWSFDDEAPIAVMAGTNHLIAWNLDIDPLRARLDEFVAQRFPPNAKLIIDNPKPGPASTIEDMMTSWQRPEVHRMLERPFEGWTMTLEDPDDPTLATLRTNAWLYPVSLIFLVTLVLVGALFTLSSASREIKLSRLQTDFVSNVSHELRTPLTSIRMFVDTLQSGRLDKARIDECLNLLAKETDRLDRRIERVLDWARMEAGRKIYETESISVQEIVDDTLTALASQTLLDEAPVHVSLPPDLPTLKVDRDAIVEALLNLLQNAVRHTTAPRKIELLAEVSGRYVGLVVQDNGPGIAKGERRRVFEKFYQVDPRLSAPQQDGANRGSGLGLAIVRAIVRAHGGRVELRSELGQGSRFTLWLPTTT